MVKVTHIRRGHFVEGESTDSPAVFLRTPQTWFSQYLGDRQTRYEGWFLTDDTSLPHGMIKLLDRITLENHGDASPDSVTIAQNTVEITYGRDTLYISAVGTAGLCVYSSGPLTRLALDPRGIYQHPEEDRDFSFAQEDSGTLIRYTDPLLGKAVFMFFMGTWLDETKGHWMDTKHPRDEARHSSPTDGWVFEIPNVSQYFSVGCGFTEEEAKHSAYEASTTAVPMPDDNALTSPEIMAVWCAEDSLKALRAPGGYYAGLPWFHQFWARDELITGLGLPRHEQLAMIEQYLALTLEHGELPTFAGSGTTCADGIGWLSLLATEYGISELPEETRAKLVEFLKTAVAELKTDRLNDNGLIYSGHNATWMDTIGRSGYRLDVQAMYALVLEITGSPERADFMANLKARLFVDGHLLDGLNDDETLDNDVRPNMFIAHLLAPGLLEKSEWETCFSHCLEELKTPQGGLTSVSHKAHQYQALSTGQNNVSYHQGDEWFFVNGLAAASLKRFAEAGELRDAANTLVKRGENETLWQHFLGCPGEIASASNGESWGCGIQGFSAGGWLLGQK